MAVTMAASLAVEWVGSLAANLVASRVGWMVVEWADVKADSKAAQKVE